VNADHDRDRAVDQALKATLGRRAGGSITPACLDAETVAAWMDGGLDAQGVAMAEAHAASCARCQALIGTLARATPKVVAESATPVRLWRWWLAPLAAGAAAVTLWMVVPTDRYTAPPQEKEIQAAPEPPKAPARDTATPAEPEAPAVARQQKTAPAAGKDSQESNKLADSAARANVARDAAAFNESKRKAEALMKQDTAGERRDRAEPKALEEQAPAPAAARPAAAPPAEAAAIGQLRAQIALPGGVQITSNSSPSPGIIWFVGRGGVVLLSVDGQTVTRLPFPETTDLTAVTASSAQIAVVTTVDGRMFRTEDGGKTWRRQ
jgi:hypothetical protein